MKLHQTTVAVIAKDDNVHRVLLPPIVTQWIGELGNSWVWNMIHYPADGVSQGNWTASFLQDGVHTGKSKNGFLKVSWCLRFLTLTNSSQTSEGTVCQGAVSCITIHKYIHAFLPKNPKACKRKIRVFFDSSILGSALLNSLVRIVTSENSWILQKKKKHLAWLWPNLCRLSTHSGYQVNDFLVTWYLHWRRSTYMKSDIKNLIKSFSPYLPHR